MPKGADPAAATIPPVPNHAGQRTQSDHQRERERAVDEDAAELSPARRLRVNVEQRRVLRLTEKIRLSVSVTVR